MQAGVNPTETLDTLLQILQILYREDQILATLCYQLWILLLSIPLIFHARLELQMQELQISTRCKCVSGPRLARAACVIKQGNVQQHSVQYSAELRNQPRHHQQPAAAHGDGGLYLEIQTKVHPKVRNHGERPYQGRLLVGSGYYCFHIYDTFKTLC